MAVAMYVQIADDLSRRIESGELVPGAQLKTEAALRQEYGREEYGRDGLVSRNTVRDAIKLLVANGLVETRPGQGTFVTRKMRPFVTRLTADPQASGTEDAVYRPGGGQTACVPGTTRPRVEVQPATGLVAAQLQVEPGSQVISRYRERRIDGIAWSTKTAFYPMSLLTRGPAATRLLEATGIDGGAVDYLRRHLQISQVAWRDTVVARPPSADERILFDLPGQVQVAMFEFRRTGYDQEKKPIRLTVTVYPADRNQFELEAGQPPEPGGVQPSSAKPAIVTLTP